MNLANKITVFRIMLVPVYLILFMQQTTVAGYAATAVFVVASLSDALDGYIARSRGLVTNFGKFFDPLADKLLVCSALIAMTSLGIFPMWATIAIVVRELSITAFREVAAASNIIIAADKLGKLKAISQMVTIICLTIPEFPSLLQFIIQPMIWFTVFITLLSGATYVAKNIKVLKD